MTDLTSLFTDLVRTETRLYNRIDARLRAGHDMPLGTLEFLRIISTRPGCRVYDIAHEVDITVGATSKGVDRLVARGWCERRANPDDRRSSLLFLTPAGEQALATATPTLEAAWAEQAAALPGPVLAQLADGLRLWRERLESPGLPAEGATGDGMAQPADAELDHGGGPGTP
ncbi:MarR family winged helix-turn-helix transcriptional regulator [Actinoplanes oblitus]|uniref:MarR family winged helix-turn-helix transcriptional regulator n=1 Tax=Actinoplanes oblitus TaxID=3040509 RepID=A0ABY8W6E2_9ACTN|nr:MarR family winged helix-turn-helix transcriptional regulator [Actinoplanes oblitus]WIM92525.1 MarR family winged helix-turn-helix transcriptional regulator [Actinoplanes oblitus]